MRICARVCEEIFVKSTRAVEQVAIAHLSIRPFDPPPIVVVGHSQLTRHLQYHVMHFKQLCVGKSPFGSSIAGGIDWVPSNVSLAHVSAEKILEAGGVAEYAQVCVSAAL